MDGVAVLRSLTRAHSASSGSSSSSMHVSLVTRPSRLRLRGIWFPSTDASIGHLLPSSTHTHTHPHTHTHATLDPSFFSPPPPKGANSTDPISDSERALRLGSTIRILRARLPTYLQTPPPPTEILSPRISLHLFPSTHPHLPAVRGRVAYLAALWTAPVVWGRVPIVGNVKLEVLSERMWKGRAGGRPTDETGEKWVVKWRTIGNGKRMWSETTTAATTATTASTPPTPSSSSSEETDDDNEFTGLFIFTFDAHGRIRSHTIENVQACGTEEDDEDRKYSSVMTLTDWLLRRVGRAGGGVEGAPGVASVDVGVGRGLGYCWTVRMGGKDGWTTRTMRTGRR
ncbi:MAG: hypothetical protein M1826_000255 [Phylliscum demangeonii]|nr:MAG: hypothetical protein M1826_000255 [Phylliscum demangeonii]